MLTFVTIPHAAAATILELVEKSFAAEEAGSIFPKSPLRGAGPVPLHRQKWDWRLKGGHIVNGL